MDSLRKEHALIVRGLAALELYVGRLEANQPVPAEDLVGFASFFTDFAEFWHRDKEEDIVLPALVRNGHAWSEGPVARLREEHEQETYLVRVVDQAARQEGVATREDRRHLIAAIRSLIDFERGHIQVEEADVYAAVSELPPDAQAMLERELAEFESQRTSHAGYADTVAKAEALFARYEGRG